MTGPDPILGRSVSDTVDIRPAGEIDPDVTFDVDPLAMIDPDVTFDVDPLAMIDPGSVRG